MTEPEISDFIKPSSIMLVADPVDEVLYRSVEGLQESFHLLLEQAHLFSLNICELLQPRLRMKLSAFSSPAS